MAEEKSITSMAITVVIALVVTCTVLFPIINSINDGGNGGGSGSNSGSEGTTETVYTLDEYYGQTYPDWPYKSYQVYSSFVQGSSPFNITTSDIIGILDNMRDMGIARNFKIAVAEIGCDNNTYINGIIRVNERVNSGLEYVFNYRVTDMVDDSNSYQGYIYDSYTAQNTQQGKQGSFDLTCSSNGEYTLNTTYYDINTGMKSKTDSGQVEFISFLSENENGYYSMVELEGAPCPIFDGQKYIMILENNTSSNTDVYSHNYFNAKMNPDISNATFTITATDNGHTYTVSGELEQLDSGNGIIADLSNVGVEPSDQTAYLMDVLISTQGTSEGDSEGGSSDNGDLGTVGTILAVVPIFVVLGILMYAVQYFRDPRKL